MQHHRLICVLTVFGATLFTTGCGDLLSLHALYTSQDKVFDPAIEGRWEDNDDVLMVQRAHDAYSITLQSKTRPAEVAKYEAHLVDIAGARFADLLPEDHIGHMFLKVTASEDQLRVAFLDSDWLRQRVPHEEADIGNGRKQAVLTAPTPQLRRLVAKYAGELRAYDRGGAYRRPK